MITRDEILAMKPGRDMDRNIAEIVFGRKIDKHRMNSYLEGVLSIPIRYYSSDISAAWEVVEKLREMNLCLNIYMYTFGCLCYISTSKGLALQEVRCDTAPEAICKAALLAVTDA